MKPTILKRNDPRRNEVIGLVRRQLAADRFTLEDVERWKTELEADVVDALVDEHSPKKAARRQRRTKSSSSKGESGAPETKE